MVAIFRSASVPVGAALRPVGLVRGFVERMYLLGIVVFLVCFIVRKVIRSTRGNIGLTKEFSYVHYKYGKKTRETAKSTRRSRRRTHRTAFDHCGQGNMARSRRTCRDAVVGLDSRTARQVCQAGT